MKKIFSIFFFIFILFAAAFYSFRNKNKALVKTVSHRDTSHKFFMGAMHDGMDYNYSYSTEIGLNVWHKYTAPINWGWINFHGGFISNDNYLTATSDYADSIRQRLDSNNRHNMYTLMDRPKFQYLAYGQRSDYQCEKLSSDSPYWFYGYKKHDVGNDVQDSGQTVRHCTTTDGQGWVVKDLISNREQTNYNWNKWNNDDTYQWFVMPKIRINPSDAQLNKKVCRIDFVKWDGTLTDSIIIKSQDFLNQGSYWGQYIEEFSFSQTAPKLKFGPGKILNPLNISFVNHANCQIDFRVWYYNECEMWIDRIRVENEPAHKLLTLNETDLTEMISEEVNQIALTELNTNNPSPLKYYVEEFEFNTVPCMAYINKKVDSLTNHRMSFMVNLNYELFNAHIPDYQSHMFTADDIKTYLIDPMQSKEIFMGAYSLEGWESGDRMSKSPNTLPVYDTYSGDYEKDSGILSHKTSPKLYDDWLQDYFDNYNTGWKATKYTYLMRMAESISRISDVPFYNLMQAHMVWSPGHMLKEPSNEELKLMANLEISFGAKGIMYFSYNSERTTFSDSGYTRGLVNTDMSPRTESVYGQNKWNAIKDINSVLEKWGPYVMRFDNTNRKSYILRLERDNLIEETFFADVLSYKPDPADYSSPQSSSEPVSQRYLQVASFRNPDEPDSKYFMIVNRRCSPHDPAHPEVENGGRFVKVKFDVSDFSGFDNWKIIDLENNSSILTFDKTIKSLHDLRWFDPGQGKLYKIVPVIQ